MKKEIIELSKYRLEKANKNIILARKLFEEKEYDFASNRIYYAVFGAIRAVNALDMFDSSKHSGVISYFNQNYVKTGTFDRDTYHIIRCCSQLREKSDYEDFCKIDPDETLYNLEGAELLINKINSYLKDRYKKKAQK